MWGGVKKRTHYGDIFKKWSASRGLEELRIALYKEPRPWYLAYSLHQCNHLLQDHHCARLLSWSTSVVELRPNLAAKQEAYRYTQEMFQLLMRHHKVGKETLNEYMRLCAVGADLTSAFDWFKYWQEAQLDDGAALHTLTWLLQGASATPSDERAEDMALTVVELYSNRFGGPSAAPEKDTDSCSASDSLPPAATHYQPTSPEDVEALRRFFSVCKALEPRLRHNTLLRDFLATVPLSLTEAASNCATFGWPVDSPHRIFPQLEQHIGVRDGIQDERQLCSTAAPPRLRDSMLHANFVAKLEASAATNSVADVVALVEEYERRVGEEKAKTSGGRTPALSKRSGDDALWCRYADPSAVAYRRRLVQEGGVTPELYHYLITALATTQPTVALRTLNTMEEANLRPLDLTRAAVLVAVSDSAEDQRRLFQQQLDEIEARTRLDAEYDTVKVVEAYWKYDYVDFFHHRNALSTVQFYLYVMARIGIEALQQLLLAVQRHGPLASAKDLVVLDEDLRRASCLFLRSRVGRTAVHRALDAISHHLPMLDISLVGTLPHFENYFIGAADDIAHSEEAVQKLVQPYDTIYVLDTSFIETSESFLSVGAASCSLVLIPYLCLAQLASSVSGTETFTSFDPALQQAIRSEPFLASQRLRGLFAMIAAPSSSPAASVQEKGEGEKAARRARVLHFTECLCANQVGQTVLDQFHLSPANNDNDQLLLVLAMLSCLKPKTTRLVLCTDDTQLVEQLESLQSSPLFGSAVEVVSTAPPANLDVEQDLINDNPVWREDLLGGAKDFVPRLSISATLPEEKISATSAQLQSGNGALKADSIQNAVQETVDAAQRSPQMNATDSDAAPFITKEVADSPWLALLEEMAEEEQGTPASTTTAGDAAARTDAPTTTPTTASASPSSFMASTADADQELRDHLMNLYETPYDVVPIGVRMEEASALGSVFAEFDSMDPEEREAQAADRAAARSRLSPGEVNGAGPPQRRHRSALEKEMLANRGYSNKDRFQIARKLSNQSGGRVPFNMRYRVVEANVRDPRNAHLRKVYQDGLEKKRSGFKRHHG